MASIEHTERKRTIDACAPLVLPAPPLDPSAPPCGHGVLVETPFDAASTAGSDDVALRFRAAEQLEGTKVRLSGEPVTGTLSLTTGRLAPHDERAAEFLREHPWVEGALVEQHDLLRGRAARAAAQRDRTPRWEALDDFEPGDLIPYHELFPTDWDLVVTHGGKTYWAVDRHCMNPACTCTEIVMDLERVDTPKSEHIGLVRVDRSKKGARTDALSPLAEEVFARVWAKYRTELVRRHDEVRRALLERARAKQRQPVMGPRPGRNDPCRCGSGKKYKRCCADKDAAVTMARGR